MNNSDYLGNRHDERLGVNKIGKNIRKSPPYPPDFGNLARQPPYPQVYNINKNDFRNTVQRLTGSPSHRQEPPLRHPQNSSNSAPNIGLQRIRPPGLAPINVNRPQMPVHPSRLSAQYGQPQPQAMAPPLMTAGGQMGWSNTAVSPISAYMRYLQHSVLDSAQGPTPPPLFPSPRMNGPTPQPPPPLLPSPRINHPLNPPSPTSQFLLSSPSGYFNLLSPVSPYPLLSPGYQNLPPLTPDFSFSPAAQSGIFGSRPPPPPSPGMGFPSPGFFQFSSPKWRD